MEVTGDQIFEKNGKHCGHCNADTLLPCEYEWTCVLCGFNLIKRKHELTKIQRKKNSVNGLKYAEHKIVCICVDVYKIYDGDDFDMIYEVFFYQKIKN